ncbi:MAG: hypothetical protein AUG04_02860 [Deltaproteobacteria bacterium 13_1_20CM_2_69_21]|nr:MAG: hypothetical protein AUG04_02860 [Deltaproteobacteria bacterium 13_1_20CM_2_69_21]
MDTTATDSRPTFSRLTEGKTRHSWRAAVPVVVVLVAIVALVAYLASRLSSYSQRADVAERDANQYRDQVAAITKQVGDLQKDVTLARSPGRTTVILEAAQPAKGQGGKKKAATPGGAWAAVAWGELPSGKTWMRVNAYGLSPSLEGGKAYHVWMQPQSGDPVDQGKSVMLTMDAQDAKRPGDVVASADLPKLKPTPTAAPPQAQAQPGEQAPATQTPQAKSGGETQQMPQPGK